MKSNASKVSSPRNAEIMRVLRRLRNSKFRSKFKLTPDDRKYIDTKGLETIRRHGTDFLTKRIAPANPVKDGKQTPWKGHPVFVAQHATATCCRKCIAKWHGIPKGKALHDDEIEHFLNVIMSWIFLQLEGEQPASGQEISE